MTASVLVPTLGSRREYLCDALQSLQSQSVSPDRYEIIVIDNSKDGAALEIVNENNKSASPPARYIHELAVGLHSARHAGARAAKGDVLVYIDDDVIVQPDWLASLIKGFDDSKVGCVGGKVVPQWEGSLPHWYSKYFDGYLSLLDLGDKPRELKWPACAWGCNMAVRRDLVFKMGGFNPDGLGDRRLIWLRGDGECGLQEKIYSAGFRIIYEPRAWLYHRIPQSRLTPEYMYWRFFSQGIQDSYTRVRNIKDRRFVNLGMLAYGMYSLLQTCRSALASWRRPNNKVRLRANAWLWYGRGMHQIRMVLSPKLKRHVLKSEYL